PVSLASSSTPASSASSAATPASARTSQAGPSSAAAAIRGEGYRARALLTSCARRDPKLYGGDGLRPPPAQAQQGQFCSAPEGCAPSAPERFNAYFELALNRGLTVSRDASSCQSVSHGSNNSAHSLFHRPDSCAQTFRSTGAWVTATSGL